MRYIKYIAVIMISIFILSSTISPVAGKLERWDPFAILMSDEHNFIEKMLLIRFYLGSFMLGTKWYIMRFTEPETFIAEPNVIGIEYLDETEITIGVINESTGGYKSLKDYRVSSLFPSSDFEITLEIPDYLPKDAFIGHFNPQFLNVGDEGEVKTTLIITSNIPKDTSLPENILLRVNITKYQTAGNLYRPPINQRGHLRARLIYGSKKAAGLSGLGIMWTINSLLPPNPFGRLYSGKRLIDYIAYVDIIVKLGRFHLVDMQPTQNLEIGPDQLISIPIEIKNLGSHIDTFNFRVSTGTDSELIVSPPPAITLESNEVGYTTIGVASPRTFNDPGTARNINIEAYSIYEPEKTFNNTAAVITRGYYVSEVGWYYGALISPFILLGIVFILYRRRRKTGKIIKKPEKPWNLPEEQKYLEKLKNKDKKEYENVRIMMEDEYKSALLWYKNYRKYLLKKEIRSYPGLKTLFKKSEKKQKKKPEYNFAKLFEKSEKKIEKPKKVEPEIIETKAEEDQLEKEQVLLRIKREQEKQRKKLKLA